MNFNVSSVSRYINIQKRKLQRLKYLSSDIEIHITRLEIIISDPIYFKFHSLNNLIKEASLHLNKAIKRLRN